MCLLQRLEYQCHHTTKTRVVVRCLDLDCLVDAQVERGSAGCDSVPEEFFTSEKLAGVFCAECSADLLRKLAGVQKELDEMNRRWPPARVDEVEPPLPLRAMGPSFAARQDRQNPASSIRSFDRSELAEFAPEASATALWPDSVPIDRKYSASALRGALSKDEIACASEDCALPAAVRLHDAQSRYCASHTCAAEEWDCVEQVLRHGSEYCPRHTCQEDGCWHRVAYSDETRCANHLWVADRKTTLKRGNKAVRFRRGQKVIDRMIDGFDR